MKGACMVGTRFVLDEEKILQEQKYDLDAMYRVIDEIAQKAQLKKLAKNHYVFDGDKNAQAYLGIFVFNHMSEYEWFTKNLISWHWLDDKEGDDDLIELLKRDNESGICLNANV